MTHDSPALEPLGAECRVFSRYLARQEPTLYVLSSYQRLCRLDLPSLAPLSLIDRGSLGLARWGTVPARIADAYARLFRPHGPLRRRLILLLAILENSPPSAAPLSAATEGSRARIMLGVSLTLLAGGACLLAGIVFLGPLHVVSAMRRSP